jgi:hypothetical protein
MKKGLLIVAAATVAALSVQVGESAGVKKATLGIKTVAGKTLHIPPGETRKEDVKCPKNFAAISAEPVPGANLLGYAIVDPKLRKGSFLFGNPSLSNTYSASGQVVCVAGAGNLYLKRASNSRAMAQASEELARRVRERR